MSVIPNLKPVQAYWSENLRELWVRIEPRQVAGGQLTMDELLGTLLEFGYSSGEHRLIQATLKELTEINWSTIDFTIERVLAIKIEAEIRVEIAEDAMTAWLVVSPAYPHETIQKRRLVDELTAAGVKFGLLEDVLDMAVEQGYLSHTVVALGQPAQAGEDAWFEYLVNEEKVNPQENGDGSVDFREMNWVTSVSVQQPLMRKHPATEGHPGMTVTGIQLCGIDGKDKPLLSSIGSEICPDDWNLLVATKGGKPICSNQSVRVDDVLTLASVGVATGNIHFNGSVVVLGNVGTGYTIEADGDIEVAGLVEGATLKAGSNIRIRRGVIGHESSRIIAQGNIEASFIEHAYVECAGNLNVVENISHSEIRVAGQVLVGIDQGRGQINGGKIFATQLVKARIIGSASATQTSISVGVDPYFTQRLQYMEQELYASKSRLEETLKSIIYLRTKSQEQKDTLSSLEQQRELLLKRVMMLKEDLSNLRHRLTDYVVMARVVGSEHVYAGVKLSLMDTFRHITEDLPGSCFVVKRESNGSQQISLSPVMNSDRQFERCA